MYPSVSVIYGDIKTHDSFSTNLHIFPSMLNGSLPQSRAPTTSDLDTMDTNLEDQEAEAKLQDDNLEMKEKGMNVAKFFMVSHHGE